MATFSFDFQANLSSWKEQPQDYNMIGKNVSFGNSYNIKPKKEVNEPLPQSPSQRKVQITLDVIHEEEEEDELDDGFYVFVPDSPVDQSDEATETAFAGTKKKEGKVLMMYVTPYDNKDYIENSEVSSADPCGDQFKDARDTENRASNGRKTEDIYAKDDKPSSSKNTKNAEASFQPAPFVPPTIPPTDENRTRNSSLKSNPTTKADIIIGETEAEEATLLYEKLLAIGKSVVDWLHTKYDINVWTFGPATPNDHPQPSENNVPPDFRRQIASLETEYNTWKRLSGQNDAHEPENNRPDSIDSANSAKNTGQRGSAPDSSKDNKNRESRKETADSNPDRARSCLEGRLADIEKNFKNHEENFTHIVAELRDCLDYCHSNYGNSESQTEVRERVAALVRIVKLHKAEMDEWKADFELKRGKD